LHCALHADDATLLEEATLLELGFELEVVAILEELFIELELIELELGAILDDDLIELLATELLVTVAQTDPVTTGFSAAAPLVSPCTPKLTDWPG
jgi:hypothetical protein